MKKRDRSARRCEREVCIKSKNWFLQFILDITAITTTIQGWVKVFPQVMSIPEHPALKTNNFN